MSCKPSRNAVTIITRLLSFYRTFLVWNVKRHRVMFHDYALRKKLFGAQPNTRQKMKEHWYFTTPFKPSVKIWWDLLGADALTLKTADKRGGTRHNQHGLSISVAAVLGGHIITTVDGSVRAVPSIWRSQVSTGML